MNSAATDDFPAKFIFRVIRRRAPMFAVVFALLFSIIAIAQYLFARHGVYRSAEIRGGWINFSSKTALVPYGVNTPYTKVQPKAQNASREIASVRMLTVFVVRSRPKH